MKGSRVVVVFALLAAALAAPAADEVKALPGWTGPLPSKIYSGFIDCGSDGWEDTGTVQLWYMFVEAEVPEPTSAPVILWSNGGPGASSAYGLFTEWGPLLLSDTSLKTNPPTLHRNPYSWTTFANVLILNGPAPVGFSYCQPRGPGGNGTSCGSWNDTRTNSFNTRFVAGWAQAFPEFSAAPFFVAGESYAGVYTTMLVSSLIDEKPDVVRLAGLALGDVCMGTDVICGPNPYPGSVGPWLSLLFVAGHGCVSLPTFNAILTQCPMDLLMNGPMSDAPAACKAAVAIAGVECPNSAYYDYNFLDQCPPDPLGTTRSSPAQGAAPQPPLEPSGYPCGTSTALKSWIVLPEVKAALNVQPNASYNSFDNGDGFVYNLTWPSGLPLLKRLQTQADGVRVLIYNGDEDPGISSFKTQNWAFSLGFPVKESWRPWTFGVNSSTVAGSVVQWQGDVTLATVRGSGHMVPAYKPYSAWLMMNTFVTNGEWPALPPSSAPGASITASGSGHHGKA